MNHRQARRAVTIGVTPAPDSDSPFVAAAGFKIAVVGSDGSTSEIAKSEAVEEKEKEMGDEQSDDESVPDDIDDSDKAVKIKRKKRKKRTSLSEKERFDHELKQLIAAQPTSRDSIRLKTLFKVQEKREERRGSGSVNVNKNKEDEERSLTRREELRVQKIMQGNVSM